MSAYRDDVEALAARDEVLTRELADKQREHDAVHRMLVEARAAEAASAPARDVVIGRHRLRRFAVGFAALVVAGVATGAVLLVQTGGVDVVEASAPQPQPQPDEVRHDLVLAAKGLARIELEPRFATGALGAATPAEVDAAVGETVEPWAQFTYTRDAQTRQAIASPLVRGGDVEPTPEFVSDGFGGVWRVIREVPLPTTRLPVTVKWMRKIWLLPAGASFRGDVQIAYPR